MLTLALMATVASADMNHEIQHLLDFVANTDCQYDRNGKIYSGTEARSHINRKYEHYRDEIQTTEDFIKYAATKSMISGDKYKLHCPGGSSFYASDWLLDELVKHRKNNE